VEVDGDEAHKSPDPASRSLLLDLLPPPSSDFGSNFFILLLCLLILVALATLPGVIGRRTPNKGKWQAALAAWLWHGSKFLWRTCRAAGRVTALDAELYAIWIGLGLAMAVPGAKSIKLFTDHFTAVRKAVDPSIHASQGHSLEVCHMLADWLRADPK
jgi:hypothetical protein